MSEIRRSIRVVAFALVLLLALAPAGAQQWDDNGPTQAFYDQQLAFLLAIGYQGSVSMLVDGQQTMWWAAGWYLDDAGQVVNNLTTTRYNVASLTKVVTAQALLQVMSQQGIFLQEPIGPYLAGIFDLGNMGTATFEEILGMASRIDDYLPFYGDPYAPRTDQQILDLVKNRARLFPSYSNTNYRLAEYLLKTLTGGTYTAYVTANLLHPECDTMLNWPFTWNGVQYVAQVFHPYARGLSGSGSQPVAPHHYTGGAGGIQCTAFGYAQTFDGMMSGWTVDPWLWQEAQIVRNPAIHYGLGLTIYGGDWARVGHNGLAPGATAQVYGWQDVLGHRIVLVGLSNNSSHPTAAAINTIADNLERAANAWLMEPLPAPEPEPVAP